jgi:Glycosyltransferase family 20
MWAVMSFVSDVSMGGAGVSISSAAAAAAQLAVYTAPAPALLTLVLPNLWFLQQANERFGEVVLSTYAAGDMVWVQDYHLMLLPSILKAAVPRAKVRAGRTPLPACRGQSEASSPTTRATEAPTLT